MLQCPKMRRKVFYNKMTQGAGKVAWLPCESWMCPVCREVKREAILHHYLDKLESWSVVRLTYCSTQSELDAIRRKTSLCGGLFSWFRLAHDKIAFLANVGDGVVISQSKLVARVRGFTRSLAFIQYDTATGKRVLNVHGSSASISMNAKRRARGPSEWTPMPVKVYQDATPTDVVSALISLGAASIVQHVTFNDRSKRSIYFQLKDGMYVDEVFGREFQGKLVKRSKYNDEHEIDDGASCCSEYKRKDSCHDRWCPHCGEHLSGYIAEMRPAA